MAPNREEFKRHDEEYYDDDDDEVVVELDEEVAAFQDDRPPHDYVWHLEESSDWLRGNVMSLPRPAAILSSDDDDSDSDSDDSNVVVDSNGNGSDDDWTPDLDEDDDDDAESETDSIKSLSAGREKTREDDLIKIIKKAKNTKKPQPPDLINDEVVTSISFSPTNDVIAVGTIEGDVCLYSYDLEKTELIMKYSAHLGNCRKVEFDESGSLLYTISNDKSIIVAESGDGKFRNAYDNAHENGIYSISVINENLFCTGDDGGVIKLWDRRKKVEAFSLKICDDYISSLCSFEENSTIACTAGNGTVAGVNMNTRRIMSKSEPYEADITCSGLFCSNTKMAVGTSVGSLLMYSWGQFASWNDEFPGVDKQKHAINCMVPITENVVITGLDNGTLRATHLFPMRHIGIVGQHGTTVESLDINRDGTLVATGSVDNKVRFWNVEYFEEVSMTDKNKTDNDRARENNLPSSHAVNARDFFAGMA